MALLTVDDLRTRALFLAGEPTAVSTSSWYDQAIEYLNEVYQALIAGGAVGEVALEAEDWLWALKNPRGRIRVLAAFNAAQTVTFTFTLDSTTVTVDSMTSGLSTVGYHLVASSSVSGDTEGAFATTVSAHTAGATTLTLANAWPYASTTGTAVVIAPLEYNLPTDFLRFASPIFPLLDSEDSPIEIIGAGAMASAWPVSELAEGIAAYAAIVGMNSSTTQQLRLSHYNRTPYDIEFEYVYAPAALTAGASAPLLPAQHRRVLSLGAAYMIANDKQNRRAASLLKQFLVAWTAMAQEYKTNVTAGIARPLILPRRSGRDPRRVLRTTSGSIIG